MAAATTTSLPTLRIADVSPKTERFACEWRTAGNSGAPVLVTAQPTNDVTYIRGIRPTGQLPADLKPYLPLYASVRSEARMLSWMAWRRLNFHPRFLFEGPCVGSR